MHPWSDVIHSLYSYTTPDTMVEIGREHYQVINVQIHSEDLSVFSFFPWCLVCTVRGVFGGPCAWASPPFESEKIDLCWCHEHHNGSYKPSWSKTCSRMHQNAPFRRRKCQNFSGAPSPDPTPSTPSAPPFECRTPLFTFLNTPLCTVTAVLCTTL